MFKKFLRYICLKFGMIALDKKFLADICLNLGLDIDGDTFIMTDSHRTKDIIAYINYRDEEIKILK